MNFGYVVKMLTYQKPDPKTFKRGRPYLNTIVAISLQDAEEICDLILRNHNGDYEREAHVCVRFPVDRGNMTIPVISVRAFAEQVSNMLEEMSNPTRQMRVDEEVR